MKFNLRQVSGIGEYIEKKEKERTIYYNGEKAFLVINPHTLEMRCEEKLMWVLIKKYETVMVSRYFGRGGIEVVSSSQLDESEVEDLVRLSYNLSGEASEAEV